ncbi:MAG TPA: cell division protein FtsA [Patescibacteria group bacterium]|nr:cell division protein FtsA [Patescibacteria group bacterium]
MSEEILVGIDLGSHAVRIAVGQRVPSSEERERLHVVGAVSIPSEGISRGTVSSLEDAVACVSRALEQAERLTGVSIERAWVGISGTHVLSHPSRGVVGVARRDGEIREADVERAMEAARTVAMPANHEILHVIPRSFTVDGQRGVKDPVGMNGIRLEVDALIIQGLGSQIRNMTKCLYRTGLDVEDLVFSPLATAEAVVTGKQKEIGVCVVNVGASMTQLAVFEEGDVLHTAVLPIGSAHITSDLAIGLRTSLEVAEQVKIRHGSALPDAIQRKEEIDLAECGAPESEFVGRRFVVDIIEARVQELFEKMDGELRKVERSGMLPAGVILTGGGAKLEGMVEAAKKALRLPVSFGTPIGVSSVVPDVGDPGMSTAIGLVLWGNSITGSSPSEGWKGLFSKVRGATQVPGGILKWFKSLKP